MTTPSPSSRGIVLDPSKERRVGIEEDVLPNVDREQVALKFLAAPINPLDLTVIDGVYPVKPQHYINQQPVLGYDGLAEVTEVGEGVVGLSKGDFVIPSKHGLGTWRNSAVVHQSWIERIPRPDDIQFGAILKGSVVPAYFLVEDMARLKPGDHIIVNAATSVISQYVIQFARLKGVRTVGVIRDRDTKSQQDLETLLVSAGAERVLTESQVSQGAIEAAGLKIVMAIDSVFGTSGRNLLKCLTTGGTYVQLGFLSGGAGTTMSVGTMDLWGKRITMHGFRGQAQLMQRSEAERQALLAWLVHAFNSKLLHLPALGVERVECKPADLVAGTLEGVLQATGKAKAAAVGQRKQILVWQD